MEHNLLTQMATFLRKQHAKRIWYRVVSCLAVIVVFCTTYALILPAITMEHKTICGLEEHAHTDDCYVTELVYPQSTMDCPVEAVIHTHSKECYDSDGNLICGYADFVVHTHDENCYSEDGSLICTLPEIEEHIHTRDCYTEKRTLICEEEEDLGHQHTASCYRRIRGDLICGLEEEDGHTHTNNCYEITQVLDCDSDEEDHEHDDSCYTEERELICDQDESEGHHHTDDCYEWTEELICTEEEREPGHIHDDSCYETEYVLDCDEDEAELHTHTDSCYDEDGKLICGKLEIEEHQHTAACILPPPDDAEPEEVKVLACGLKEHTHSEACYPSSAGGGIAKDEESEEDWKDTMKDIVLTRDYHQDVLAIAESQIGYQESIQDTVVTEDGEVRGYSRYGDWYGDKYGDWCAMFVSFCLHYAEVEDMPLEASCTQWIEALTDCDLYHPSDSEYVPIPGELIFFDLDEETGPDHVGLVAKLLPETEDNPACIDVIEGNSSDQVRHVIYELADGRIQGYGHLPEQTFYCGQTAHVHTNTCENSGEVICELDEHIHTDECFESPQQQLHKGELTELVCTGPDYTIQVLYGADAGLPDGVTLEARELLPDSEEYRDCYNQTVEILGSQEDSQPELLVFARFFDIHFTMDGEELEPASPVFVTITYDTVTQTAEPANYQAIHFAPEGPELLEVWADEQEEGPISLTHSQDSFSIVGSLKTISAPENSTDIGPDILPVDYYVYIDDVWTCVGSTKTGWNGDYNTENLSTWTNTNRDFITVDQASSILSPYGFDIEADNAALQIAYQRKETDQDAALHCDTQSYSYQDEGGNSYIVLPLARNLDPASGYNLYFLPGNSNTFSSTLNEVNKSGSEFYTVSIYDPNHLVYASNKDLPETQTVRKGGTVDVTVKALPESSGAVWQCVNTRWEQQGNGTESSEGTVSFHLTDVTQTLRITPVASNLGTSINKTVYYLVFLDGQWTDVGTTTPYYDNPALLINADGTNHRHFVTSAQAESVLGPYGFRSNAYSSSVGGTSVLAHQLNKYDLNTQFWTDGGGQQLSDGSWAIGMSYSTNDCDYSLYYLPVHPEVFQGKTPASYTSDSPEMEGNRFWSVRVRDDDHDVYSDGELIGMVQYVGDHGTATVTVRNAAGMLWSCRGVNGEDVTVESAQSEGYTTFTISNISQPIEVTATKANPSFTVQYYGNIPRFATSGSNALKVIDTSAAANNGNVTLPWNGGNMATKSLYLEATGENTAQNAGDATSLYRVKTTMELTKLYSDETFQYETHPGLYYFNKLKDNESYTLKEIWVLKSGKDAGSTNRDDWDIYAYTENTDFTNEASQAIGNTILITDGAVIRLVTDSSTGDYYNGTTFYDYDISSGYNGGWRTGITGINSESNYGSSLNGQRNWRSGADIFAFGNQNCGTGMSGYLFDGGALNKANSKNPDYMKATFKLVSGLNSDGTIRYNDWIVAPKLFNESDGNTVTGKQTYDGSSLTFDRLGDTYTLSAATLKNYSGQDESIDELQYFFHPSPAPGRIWDGEHSGYSWQSNIFTNNFWPMDKANNPSRKDQNWGTYGNPGQFEGFTESNSYNWSGKSDEFPPGDDGNAHNWFFGMNFALSFSLTADYEGPLEYYFFGDDDLWVFLDDQLVCDIGGVHSSIGEFVDLRDYLPVGSSGQHTLSFFYTERGASGSTCYMSFTLPSVSSATTERDTGKLQISKALSGGAGLEDVEYEFQVDLLASETGTPLNQTFSYTRSDGTYGIIKSGGTIKLHADETAVIGGLPAGAYYTVTELSHEGYKTTVNGREGYIISDKVVTGGTAAANFVNTPYYELPETGGSGTDLYTMGGLLLMAGAGLLLYIQTRRRKEDPISS